MERFLQLREKDPKEKARLVFFLCYITIAITSFVVMLETYGRTEVLSQISTYAEKAEDSTSLAETQNSTAEKAVINAQKEVDTTVEMFVKSESDVHIAEDAAVEAQKEFDAAKENASKVSSKNAQEALEQAESNLNETLDAAKQAKEQFEAISSTYDDVNSLMSNTKENAYCSELETEFVQKANAKVQESLKEAKEATFTIIAKKQVDIAQESMENAENHLDITKKYSVEAINFAKLLDSKATDVNNASKNISKLVKEAQNSLAATKENTAKVNDAVNAAIKASKAKASGGGLTKSKGVFYFNGHRETWYSERVLPGGGLHIPGRHTDEAGLVRDGDGYICVASVDYPKGTVVQTSLGAGKVYDSGCASGTIDIYTNW